MTIMPFLRVSPWLPVFFAEMAFCPYYALALHSTLGIERGQGKGGTKEVRNGIQAGSRRPNQFNAGGMRSHAGQVDVHTSWSKVRIKKPEKEYFR